MSDLFWLSKAQMRRIEPCFPLSHGVPRVDDRRVISGIIFVIRNGLRWRDAPKDYGVKSLPTMTPFSRPIATPLRDGAGLVGPWSTREISYGF